MPGSGEAPAGGILDSVRREALDGLAWLGTSPGAADETAAEEARKAFRRILALTRG